MNNHYPQFDPDWKWDEEYGIKPIGNLAEPAKYGSYKGRATYLDFCDCEEDECILPTAYYVHPEYEDELCEEQTYALRMDFQMLVFYLPLQIELYINTTRDLHDLLNLMLQEHDNLRFHFLRGLSLAMWDRLRDMRTLIHSVQDFLLEFGGIKLPPDFEEIQDENWEKLAEVYNLPEDIREILRIGEEYAEPIYVEEQEDPQPSFSEDFVDDSYFKDIKNFFEDLRNQRSSDEDNPDE